MYESIKNRTIRLSLLLSLSTLSCFSIALTQDPLDPLNRKFFAFNEVADRLVLRPIANTYHTLIPAPAQGA